MRVNVAVGDAAIAVALLVRVGVAVSAAMDVAVPVSEAAAALVALRVGSAPGPRATTGKSRRQASKPVGLAVAQDVHRQIVDVSVGSLAVKAQPLHSTPLSESKYTALLS